MQFLLKSITDSFDSFEIVFSSAFDDVPIKVLYYFGTISISPCLEWIFAFELQQEGNFLKCVY